ncbi:MAG: hypothetical protein AAFP86_10940, partial [Planctomycetota bacterium]
GERDVHLQLASARHVRLRAAWEAGRGPCEMLVRRQNGIAQPIPFGRSRDAHPWLTPGDYEVEVRFRRDPGTVLTQTIHVPADPGARKTIVVDVGP